MPDLLIELFSEDIPARMQPRGAEDLKRLITEQLADAGLGFETAEAHSTPRRLALHVTGVPARQPDLKDERRGPRVGAPDQAIQGFLKGAGLDSLDRCEQRGTGKGVFWFAVIDRPGQPTVDLVPAMVEKAVADMPWPKSMRWARSSIRWVRPLQNILVIFDGEPVKHEMVVGRAIVMFNNKLEEVDDLLPFGRETIGHRFLAPAPFAVHDFASYKEGLAQNFVVLDRDERRKRIVEGAAEVAAAKGLKVVDDPGLVEEVTGLVEWPVPLLGTIDADFMGLPPEVRQTTMRENQKYFATVDADGRPAPYFVLVANMVADDGGDLIVGGNERVLRARLSDARFFWDQDRKVKLADRLPALSDIVFHARLGTVTDKVERLTELAGMIAADVPGADQDAARLAARLAKADLVTGMVGEFPELQGVMGRYYAAEEGVAPEVAGAIEDHYRPLGPSDRCPAEPVGMAVALADKIDSLTGFFAIDEKPTGSRDPFALRRAALGVIRIILENRLRLPLARALEEALGLYRIGGLKPAGEVVDELLVFFADRLKVTLRDRGVRHDLIDAVFARGGPGGGRPDDLTRLIDLVEALQAFLASEDGSNLLTAYRRASNILRIEEQKDGVSHAGEAEAARLVLDQETALAGQLQLTRDAALPHLEREDFAGCMAALAELRGPVDAFFDHVKVNDDDPALRANRLKLLSQIRDTMDAVADFSKVEG